MDIQMLVEKFGLPADILEALYEQMTEYRENGSVYGDSLEGFQEWRREKLGIIPPRQNKGKRITFCFDVKTGERIFA